MTPAHEEAMVRYHRSPDGGPGDAIHEAGDWAVWPHEKGGTYIARHDPATGEALSHFWHERLLDDHRFPDDQTHVARKVADRLAAGRPVRLMRFGEAVAQLPHGVLADKLEENDWHHDEETLHALRKATWGTLPRGHTVHVMIHPESRKAVAWHDAHPRVYSPMALPPGYSHGTVAHVAHGPRGLHVVLREPPVRSAEGAARMEEMVPGIGGHLIWRGMTNYLPLEIESKVNRVGGSRYVPSEHPAVRAAMFHYPLHPGTMWPRKARRIAEERAWGPPQPPLPGAHSDVPDGELPLVDHRMTRLAAVKAPAGGGISNNSYQPGGRFMAAPFARIRDVAARLRRLRLRSM